MSGTVTLVSPLPSIAANISISGATGPGFAIQVARDGAAPAFRIFTVQGAVQFDLSWLTVAGGLDNLGGGIYVPEGGTANLYNVDVFSNRALGNGGGIYNFGTVTIENSRIDSNRADDARGGGIYNYGSLWVQFGSTVNGNSARWEGGGIYNQQDASAIISDSTIAMNWAGDAAVGNFGSGGG
ncbi:MAG: hypothetical protein AAB289_03680, partial [Chloroflexota bacterium]